MARKKKDGVFLDANGIYWAYYNGKRKTANCQSVAWDVYQAMKDKEDRIQAEASGPGHTEVVILRGVPGCGKTTWAKEWMAERSWYKRINRDLLRQMFDFGTYGSNREKFIRKMRDELIRECLQAGFSVIVDDTNLKRRDISEISDMAHIFNHVISINRIVAIPVRIMDFDTPLEECIRRDALREKPVGADRILVMWYSYRPVDSDEEFNRLLAAEERLREQDT